MNIIKNDLFDTIIIKKSKFIAFLYRVENEKEVNDKLSLVRQKYVDASHICYAYVIDNQKRFFDDSEPSNTAGKPMLDVLEKKELNYVLAIVVRYFGGIKLGSSGLIRAYANSINNLLVNNTKVLEYGYRIIINDNYEYEKTLDYILKNSIIISKCYTDKISIEAIVNDKTLDKLSNINLKIIGKVLI